ncbi:Butyrophilin-like protein 10 [Triplophysa tibetana]|uniref:Butyrophilin-like protein 10 n=1 Tax=Triplophysa tibetana TaxID=1572043 RepID=A0A5A9NAX1_9TELE|nr:Butyrophilin-like protein 10 [Triplophysa tibetana]
MRPVCVQLTLINAHSPALTQDEYEVIGPSAPVMTESGEDVILPCSIKPNISAVNMRVEWFRLDMKDSIVHLYKDHKDINTDQLQSYRGRTQVFKEELEKGNTSLKLSRVKISDEGLYKCFIQSQSWSDDIIVNVTVEAVCSVPVITVDGFDGSGGLRLQCESKGWNPEPDVVWLNSEGVTLTSESPDTHRDDTDGFSVKHKITVYNTDTKYHCRVRMRHHMMEAEIIPTGCGLILTTGTTVRTQQYGHNTQQYGHNTQQYGHNTQQYGHNTQQYGHNTQQYGHNTQQYGHNTQQYGHNRQQYGHNRQQYGHNRQQYGHNTQQYGHNTQHNSTGTTHNSTGTTHNSTGTTHNSTGTTHNSTGTTHNSTGTTHNSTGTTDNSTGTTDNSTGTTDNSTGTTDNSTGTTDNSTGTTDNSTGTTDNSTGTTDNSTGTTDNIVTKAIRRRRRHRAESVPAEAVSVFTCSNCNRLCSSRSRIGLFSQRRHCSPTVE